MPMTGGTIITRCPGCATAFRASESQLTARDGRVRCGQCKTIFDARVHAVPANRPPIAPSESGTTSENATEFPDLPEGLVLTHAPAQDPVAAIADTTLADAATTNAPSVSADPNLEFDFDRSPKPAGAVAALLAWTALALLVGVLAAQIAFHYRGEITLAFPEFKPYAQELCADLGCDLPLPRRSELLSIEVSDLQADPVNPGVMVLSATLRNRAPYAQLPPALELTLTDPQDKAVARRVLAATDYLARGAEENSFPASTEMPIKVFFDASAIKATGYRLYLFYP